MHDKSSMWKRRLIAWYTPYGLYWALRRALKGCETVLDLGCWTDSILHLFSDRCRIVGVDRYLPSLEANRRMGTYAGQVNADILDLPVADKSVDACVALDLIEHFERPDGERLIAAMERVARKRVIIYTPNGFVPQPAADNPWQLHRSGWNVADFRSRGYRVHGIYGHKALRGELAKLRYRPRLFWEGVSFLSQGAVFAFSSLSYGLACVKAVLPNQNDTVA